MKIEFIYAPNEINIDKKDRPFLVADALKESMSDDEYRKVIAVCAAEIKATNAERLKIEMTPADTRILESLRREGL